MKKLYFYIALLCSHTLIAATPPLSIDSMTAILATTLTDSDRVNTLNTLGKTIRNKDAIKAFAYAQESYKLSSATYYEKGIANSSELLGLLYLNFGDYKKALFHHFQALKIVEKLNDKKGIAFSYNNLGAVYSHLKNYPKAKSCYQKSLDIKLANGMFKEASSSYINLGNIGMYQKKIDECIRYYSMGFINAQKYDDKQNITIALMNLGEAYYDKKELYKALSYYNKAIGLVKKLDNKYLEAQIYFAYAKIYDLLEKFDVSEIYFNKALIISTEHKIRPLELNIYKYASQMYEHKHDAQKALLLNKKFIALNDSIYSEENAKTISEMQTLYELKNKEEEIKLLNKENEIITANKNRETVFNNFLIIGCILISIIALLFYRSISRKQRTNRLLNLKNSQIEWQRSEIERKNVALNDFNKELMKENVVAQYEILKTKINPHFLFNSLNTLSNLIIKSPANALDFVSRFSKIYRHILELENHQLITIENELAFANEFIHLQQIRFKDNLLFTNHIHKVHLQELIPPFAIQLVIENAIKHNIISAEHKLIIKVYSENDGLMITNNFQPKNKPEDSTKIGQKNIIDRYKLVSRLNPDFYIDDNRYISYLPIIKKDTL